MKPFRFLIASWLAKRISKAGYYPWAFGIVYEKELAMESFHIHHRLIFYFYKWMKVYAWKTPERNR